MRPKDMYDASSSGSKKLHEQRVHSKSNHKSYKVPVVSGALLRYQFVFTFP